MTRWIIATLGLLVAIAVACVVLVTQPAQPRAVLMPVCASGIPYIETDHAGRVQTGCVMPDGSKRIIRRAQPQP